MPAPNPIMTRWAKAVSPSNALPEYPRPQLVRKDWMNLNGLWQFEVDTAEMAPPVGKDLPEQILVPFPIESALSGVKKHPERAWYRRTFTVPNRWNGQRILLHFGAVDWEATVYLNGQQLGVHRGGYDAFTFDLTDHLKPDGPQELIVGVFDPTDAGNQPRGKQVNKPGGIFYTPTTGIWQTVWLEPVPQTAIGRLTLTSDVDTSTLKLLPAATMEGPGLQVEAVALDGKRKVGSVTGTPGMELRLPVPHPKLWTPERPFLYGLKVTLKQDGKVVDEVSSYFGMRKIEVASDGHFTRMMLNGKPVFGMGVLDQGFWPDGIYTAPTDAALRFDIEQVKRLGMNTIRKHVKIEPERWYYWADKLGVLVWQDMPAGDNRTPESHDQFQAELNRMIEERRNHPSIIMWVVFNEGWGQHDTERLVRFVEDADPSRLVDNASGWTDMKVGDVVDMHNYPGPGSPPSEPARAAVLGEYGGLGLRVSGHAWSETGWGYQQIPDQDALTRRYEDLQWKVWQLKESSGLCAAIYTQITDVETESNGLFTYDRAVLKVNPRRARLANTGKLPPPKPVKIVPPVVSTAREEPARWRYTFQPPPDGWTQPAFDDSAWREGEAGFGTEGTPGATVRTVWDTPDIWLRREITLPDPLPKRLQLLLHHDEDAEVYVNGVLAAQTVGYTTDYEPVPLPPQARAALHPGKNLLAVHCRQTAGGQYIDVGIIAPRSK
jgi:hypothetical protein